MGECQQNLNDHDEWNERRDNRLDSFPGAQRSVVAGANDLDDSVQGKETRELVA